MKKLKMLSLEEERQCTLGEEAEFNLRHVKQDIHRVREQRARDESLNSKDVSRVATSMVVLDTQQCTLCRVLHASRHVCLTFLIFCKHLEGRELGMSLFHGHYHTQHRAHRSTELSFLWLQTRAGLCLSEAEPTNCLTCHIIFQDNRS